MIPIGFLELCKNDTIAHQFVCVRISVQFGIEHRAGGSWQIMVNIGLPACPEPVEGLPAVFPYAPCAMPHAPETDKPNEKYPMTHAE